MDKALATEDEDFQVSDVSKSSDEISAEEQRVLGSITLKSLRNKIS